MKIDSKAEASTPLPRLRTPIEAATMLRISRAGVYRLVESRSLPFYRVKGSLRFSETDIIEYLSNNRVESVS